MLPPLLDTFFGLAAGGVLPARAPPTHPTCHIRVGIRGAVCGVSGVSVGVSAWWFGLLVVWGRDRLRGSNGEEVEGSNRREREDYWRRGEAGGIVAEVRQIGGAQE